MRANRLLHLLDRYLGIPLIFLLGLFRKRCNFPSLPPNAKIGLLNTAAIGDTILLSGAIADLHAHFPHAELLFFSGPSNYEAALLIPHVQVIKLPVISPRKTIQLIRKHTFDLWVDFGPWPRLNALYSHFAKAKFKIGFQTPGQYRHYIYDRSALHQAIHELENYRHLIALIGVKGNSPPVLALEKSGPIDPNQFVLHLYAGGSQAALKQWPENHWIKLIDHLTKKGYRICLTGNQRDEEKCKKVKQHCQNPEQIEVKAGQLSLRKTALLLKASNAVISVDTGIMHLAAALGCFTIALHGPTSPHRWGAIGPRAIAITPKKPYSACIHLGFEKISSENCSMKSIQVNQII